MIAEQQINQQSGEERCAWLNSLNDEENLIVHCPTDHRYTLIFVSIVKRALVGEMSSAYRIRFLEWLKKCGDRWLSPDMVAAVEPMCDEGYEIVREAMKLGSGKYLDVFASWEVFNAFIALNPSILTAVKMSSRSWPQKRSA